MIRPLRVLLVFGLFLIAEPGFAQQAIGGLPAVTVTPGAGGTSSYSLSIQVLVLMTLITLLPSIVLMMTAFTRIIVVLGLLRQALGTGQTPSNPVLIGLALFMTLFVMQPVIDRVYNEAVTPYLDGQLEPKLALEKASQPIRDFMLKQTRETELMTFAKIAKTGPFESPEQIPFAVLAAAFVTSELTTAFQIGFLLFIPFIVIDLVVSSVLMSMGMMMLSPMLISAPFKLMLFVLVDGWAILMASLAGSFAT
ncbi:flagellar biosynthetic protein FliP [Panacagrimonas perspica]|uniref:Flagellar biosynthetic protein FliP n=1 Tax=Panacagrimonas perspica TaxID=381431 RepID=A0A4R7NX33_9GAMM|nr:flagellar type III secretion system pore protein FliP [Panacagrimonas perspica]TDU25803.1 flagellar biosynthetic protein FliP [Panacagrimonas perspica]THD02826.1 flagellar biosynthetic protein FliP [Panacagrimonas perspica]